MKRVWRWLVKRWRFGAIGEQVISDCACFLEVEAKAMVEQRRAARDAFKDRALLTHSGALFEAMSGNISQTNAKAQRLRKLLGPR